MRIAMHVLGACCGMHGLNRPGRHAPSIFYPGTPPSLYIGAQAVGGRRSAVGDRRTADGGRRTADGGRRSAVGDRRTADGGRRTAVGGRRTADGGRRTADGGRRSAVGGRRSAVGGRRSANGGRRLRKKGLDVPTICVEYVVTDGKRRSSERNRETANDWNGSSKDGAGRRP